MGAVYRGYHLYLKKRVAVKVLQPDLADLPELVTRFEREAIAGAHVSHPHVAAATDFGKLDDGSFFLVIEYVRGVTLTDIVRRGKLGPWRAVRIARQIALALDAVHALGIVHRDVKSRNVMIVDGSDDFAKLIDFGLARVQIDRLSPVAPRRSRHDSAPAPARLTGAGEVFGTVAYLAPEAAHGMDAVDGRSDLYALGVVLYEMLAGRRPFTSLDAGELFQEQLAGVPSIAARAPDADVPVEIEAVVRRLLARDPADRFQTGASVAAAIDAALSAMVPPPSSTTGAALPPKEPEPSAWLLHGWRLPVAGAVVVAALALSATAGLRARSTTRMPTVVSVAPSSSIPAQELAGVVAAPPSTVDMTAARQALSRGPRTRDFQAAGRALVAIAQHDADALREPELAAAAREVVVGLGADAGADEVFDVLAQRAGPAGLDVLYSIVEQRGRTRASARAAELLRRPEIMAQAPPQLALAFALRDAPCARKLDLLDRAAAEGDARALVALETMGRACFPRQVKVESAIQALRARLPRR